MNVKDTIDSISQGAMDETLASIYAGDIACQRDRYVRAIGRFTDCFGDRDVHIFSAPGRTEIGGNHTDHQQGEVLAAAIDLDAIGVVATTNESIVRVVSEGYDEIVINLDKLDICEAEKGTSTSLIKGILKGFKDYGYEIGGLVAYITSDVLVGAGLSSSAVYETLIGTILSGLYNHMTVDAVDVAKIGQYSENIYFGKPCGLMDQMASSVGDLVHIDFADKDNPKIDKLNFDIDRLDYALCITDTKGSHVDLTEDYGAIPEEMRQVARYFGQDKLLGVTLDMIHEHILELREKIGDRPVLRAIHFIGENQRVKDEVAYIRQDDMEGFLKVYRQSGDSSYKYLQNIYSDKDVKHQNVSIALALSDSFLLDEGASRVHGGGFAGTIQAFVKKDRALDYKAYMDGIFGEGSCVSLSIRKYGGIKVL